jgi:hypothetical protein
MDKIFSHKQANSVREETILARNIPQIPKSTFLHFTDLSFPPGSLFLLTASCLRSLTQACQVLKHFLWSNIVRSIHCAHNIQPSLYRIDGSLWATVSDVITCPIITRVQLLQSISQQDKSCKHTTHRYEHCAHRTHRVAVNSHNTLH